MTRPSLLVAGKHESDALLRHSPARPVAPAYLGTPLIAAPNTAKAATGPANPRITARAS